MLPMYMARSTVVMGRVAFLEKYAAYKEYLEKQLGGENLQRWGLPWQVGHYTASIVSLKPPSPLNTPIIPLRGAPRRSVQGITH